MSGSPLPLSRLLRLGSKGVDVVALLSVAALAVAISGCSSGSKTSASSIALGTRDLPPGWIADGRRQPPDAAQRNELYACLATPVPKLTSQSASATLNGPGGVVAFSVTQVFPSVEAAAADFALQHSRTFPACAQSLVTQLFAGLPAGTSFGSPTVTMQSTAPFGGGAGVAYRFALPTNHGGATTTAIADSVTALDGPAEVTVSFVSMSDPSLAVSEQTVMRNVLGKA